MNYSCLFFRYYSVHELPSLRITLSVLLNVTLIPTVSLNSLILYSIWKTQSLHKPSYLLLANLALSDLLFGAIGEPVMIIAHVAYIKKWRRLCCYITPIGHFTGYWLALVSLYSLTLISIDRLLAIRLKNRYRSFVTSRRVWMVTVPYWIGTFLLYFALLVANALSYVQNIVVPSLLFVFLVTITLCYSMAFYSLKKLTSSVSSSSQQPPDNGTNTFDVSQYRRSMNTMVLVMLTTFLLYLPYLGSAVTYSKKRIEGNSFPIISYKAVLISQLIVATNSTVNPLLYLWRMRDIRQAVRITVKRILRRELHLDHVLQP